jgi:AraC-like DNA-binding protein
MLPVKETVDLSEYPIKYFVRTGGRNNAISAHPHWHNAVEILYVADGAARQQLGDRIVTIEQGDLAVIWRNQFHSTYSVTDGRCEIAVLQLNTDSFIHPVFNAETLDKTGNLFFFDKVKTTEGIGAVLLRYVNQMIEEHARKTEGSDFFLRAAVHLFIGEILRNAGSLPVYAEKKYSENDKAVALRVFRLIEENYNEELTLNQAAGAVGLSATHFLRVFKNVSGMTFKQYLNHYRVNKSTEYLRNGDGVTETAMKCGFSDVNTFIRNFKKHKGATPSQYKR